MALFKWNKKYPDKKEEKPSKTSVVKPAGSGNGVKAKKSAETKEPAKASMKDLYGDKEAAGAEESKTGTKTDKKTRKYGSAYRVIIRPLITEKAANLGAVNKYAFVVSDRANKIEVEKAVNELYGIKPTSVNMLKVLGKKTRRGRVTGRRKNWKKAIVTLPKGKSINIYEGV